MKMNAAIVVLFDLEEDGTGRNANAIVKAIMDNLSDVLTNGFITIDPGDIKVITELFEATKALSDAEMPEPIQ